MTAECGEVVRFREYLEERVGRVRLSVLHQRLRDEHGLGASWATFYRYVLDEWPERVRPLPPGDEAQVDFFYMGRWHDPDVSREMRAPAEYEEPVVVTVPCAKTGATVRVNSSFTTLTPVERVLRP